MAKQWKKHKRIILVAIGILLLIFFYNVFRVNILDRICFAGHLRVNKIYDAFEHIPELEGISDERLEGISLLGGNLCVEYDEQILHENTYIKIQFPENVNYVIVCMQVWLSDDVCTNLWMKYKPDLRTLIYEPIDIVIRKNEGLTVEHYTDENSVYQYLQEYNVTEKDIEKYQEYALYDVVTKTWVETHGGIFDIEKWKLKHCKIIDNTFNFEDEEGNDEIRQELHEGIEKFNEKLSDIIYENEKIEAGEPTTMILSYSREKKPENCEVGMFDEYAGLMDDISAAFVNGTIEEWLKERNIPGQLLTEDEVQQLINNENYGVLAKFEEEPWRQNSGEADWYIVEQTEERKDVVVIEKVQGQDYVIYYYFKCHMLENGKIRGDIGRNDAAAGAEHFFIEHNGLKYLLVPKRASDGSMQGIALHLYDMKDYIGGILYFKNTGEISYYGCMTGSHYPLGYLFEYEE